MLRPGIFTELTFLTTEDLTARSMGSGTLPVLATPAMIAKMEQAAWSAVATYLEPGTGTVGTLINVRHTSATPMGMAFTCRAELTAVEGRRLIFRVTARDAHGSVGEGVHERAIIREAPFISKAYRKLNPEE
ncbi:MAG: thioesterase family protein [Ruminiclostridium sp.]|nr:thioesterase family protein [Ruminiclostridium sp.]